MGSVGKMMAVFILVSSITTDPLKKRNMCYKKIKHTHSSNSWKIKTEKR
jgi:hypothetical protein